MAIKTIPEDFVVIEQLAPAWLDGVRSAPLPGAPFAMYRLDKRDMTTPDACDAIARALHVPPKLVSAAGLKDRQAVTTQHITVGPLRPNIAMPRHLQFDTWRIARLGFCEKAINASAIAANRFELVLRTLTRKAIDDMDAAVDRIRVNSSTLRFVNYFGSQRFGSARHREGFAAHYLCKGDFAEALRLLIAAPHKNDTRNVKLFKRIVRDKWPPGSLAQTWRDMLTILPGVPERGVIEYLADHPDDYRGAFRELPYFTQQMCVEAYQSWLWNRIAREVIVQWCQPDATFTVPDTFNDLTFPIPGALPRAIDHRLLDMNLPVLGRDSELTGPWAPAAGKILNEENLTPAELTIPGADKPAFNQVNRQLIVDATDLRIDDPLHDELQTKARRFKRTIRFTLPRGSYATIALRAIGN
ncbi:MAG: tRNA pseudouridine(13) synthase TruD [Phycisphaeraceae bacterium]